MKRKAFVLAATPLIAVSLAGCKDLPTSENQRPFITVSPSGNDVICTWENWNGRDGNEWECEAIKDGK